jgi:hypothetical protein
MTYGAGSHSTCRRAAEQDDPGWLAIGCPFVSQAKTFPVTDYSQHAPILITFNNG